MKAKRRAIAPVVFCFLILAVVGTGSPPFLAAQDIVVESADPPAAEQGTVNLDVEIKGSGFERGAAAKFFVSGTDFTDPGGITVNSTTFKGRARLIANITVAEGATISKFDIQVQSNGRIGKGIELFQVNAKTNQAVGEEIPVTVTFRDCTGFAFGVGLTDEPCLADPYDGDGDGSVYFKDRLRSDGMGSYTAGGADIGISAHLGKNSGGLRFGIHSTKKQQATRRLFVDFSDCAPRGACTSTPLPPGFDESSSFSSLVGGDGGVTWWTKVIDFREMPVGEPKDLIMGVTIDFSLIRGGQWRVNFNRADFEACPGSSPATVTRTAVDTWVIEADRDDIACLTEWKGGLQFRGLYHMPFKIKVVCKDGLQCVAPSP